MSTDAGRMLRLALAMRGRVSLAVWIGGAVAELDRLRSARPDDGSTEDIDPAEDPEGFRRFPRTGERISGQP
jgi:hypothetical protein